MKPASALHNGIHHTAQRVELGDTIVVATSPEHGEPDARARELDFEVVALVGESDDDAQYAICYCQAADEFMVADAFGRVLTDEALAQDVLNDFLEHAESPAPEERS